MSLGARHTPPGGVDAVLDHLGGPSFERSFKLLAPGGTLVAYGMAAQRDGTSNVLFTLTPGIPAGRAASTWPF